jgi:hypothetical protein
MQPQPLEHQSLEQAQPARTWIDTLLAAGIVGCLTLKLLLAGRINIHWDEFYFLSMVHDYLRGDLTARLQTFHVHLFSWLAFLPLDEAGQIIVGRLVMAILGFASASFLYAIARHFASRRSALLAVFFYVSATVVMEHGASFRVDPIVILLSLAAIHLALLAQQSGNRQHLYLGVAGLLMALALLLTIKSVFFAGIIGLIVLCTAGDRRQGLLGLALFGAVLVLAAGLLYAGHVATLSTAPAGAVGSYLKGTASKVLLEDGLIPRWQELILLSITNILFVLMALDGARAAWRGRRLDWRPLILALPLLTPLFYRNAFAYYFVLILPSAAILAAISCDRQRQRLAGLPPRAATRLVALFILLQAAILGLGNWRLFQDTMAGQRRTLDGIHAIFTMPVPYIDGYGVVARFPRLGFFMSSWGMDQYQQEGRPVFPALIAAGQPPLLLADSIPLYHALIPNVVTAPAWHLLPADRAFLADNFIRHWGLVFVAGKILQPTSGSIEATFEIAIAGDYRVTAEGPIRLDGHEMAPDDVVTLGAGAHTFQNGTNAPATLRWAAAGDAPVDQPIDLADFFDIGLPRR